jgi:YesN/AraC family two-component response regulator
VFKRATGFTVKEYVIKHRLTQAKHLLLNSSLSLIEIADKAGFKDPSYFGRMFRKYERTTPGQFRQEANNPF